MINRPLRVCIDARLESGRSGGVEQFVIGLARGLSQLDDGDEEYLFLVRPHEEQWLLPYLSGRSTRLCAPEATVHILARKLKGAFRAVPLAKRIRRRLPAAIFSAAKLPASDGTIERAGAEVVHFTTQSAFLTDVPSIYHPHDLQHLHLPEFFTPRQRRDRELAYRSYCEQAAMVAVASSWTRDDVVRHYGLPSEKVAVVALAPPIAGYPIPTEGDLAEVRRKFALPAAYLLYPAQTWPHKNHVGLLRALARLRDLEGIKIPLVCSGFQNHFYETILKEIRTLGMENQVSFAGFVTPIELQSLYRLAAGVVIPTKFEAGSFPLFEAFQAGVAAACSNVTSLPEQAGEAALLFDPDSVEDMAAAVRRLWTDQALRDRLAALGRERARDFTWEKTARVFRAHYRRLGGRQLTDEDELLLKAPALI